MFKKLVYSLVFAVALLWGVQTAKAVVVTSSETDFGLNAANEATDSITVNGVQDLYVFMSGTYGASTDIRLQKEVGSPGSGAWQDVARIGNDTANATVSFSWPTDPGTNAYRVRMRTFVSGAVGVQMTDNSSAPFDFSEGRTYVRYFEDFFTDELLLTEAATAFKGFWLTDEDSADGTVCVVTDTQTEGAVTCISGVSGSGNDTVFLSHTDVTDQAGLVSDGRMGLETRLQYDDASGTSIGVSLLNLEGAATGLEPVTVVANVVTFITATYQDGVGFFLGDDATTTDNWNPWSANADAEGNDVDSAGTGDEFEAFTSPGVDTYMTLRMETDSAGHCYWFASTTGTPSLVYAEAACVATAAVLAPFIWVNTSAIANDATTLVIDYVEFAFARPAT